MRRRVVITGLGAITPLGNNVEENWKAAVSGKNGIDYIKGYDKDLTDIQLSEFAADIRDYIASAEVFGSLADNIGDLIYKEGDEALAITEDDKNNVKNSSNKYQPTHR